MSMTPAMTRTVQEKQLIAVDRLERAFYRMVEEQGTSIRTSTAHRVREAMEHAGLDTRQQIELTQCLKKWGDNLDRAMRAGVGAEAVRTTVHGIIIGAVACGNGRVR